jgi:hypothetical protein
MASRVMALLKLITRRHVMMGIRLVEMVVLLIAKLLSKDTPVDSGVNHATNYVVIQLSIKGKSVT